MTDSGLKAYGDLVREYHATLDLISGRALDNWDALVQDALLYAEVIGELLPQATSIVDVGSGAGLPGLPLAVSRPDWTVQLVERRRRRAAFLNLAKGRLGLQNTQVHQADVQQLDLAPAQGITAQAVGSFAAVYGLTRHLHASEIVLVSSKGGDWQDEAGELLACSGMTLLGSATRPRSAGTGLVVGLLLPGGLECR